MTNFSPDNFGPEIPPDESLDETITGLSKITGQSEADIRKWLERQEEDESLRAERDVKISQWSDEALGDEEHSALTIRLLQFAADSDYFRERLLRGTITLEQIGEMASFTISVEDTQRNFGAAPSVGRVASQFIDMSE